MLPDRVSNPGPLTYESDALPIALRGPALQNTNSDRKINNVDYKSIAHLLKGLSDFKNI